MHSDLCMLLMIYSCIFLVCVIIAKVKLDRHRQLERCEWGKQAQMCRNLLWGLLFLELYCCLRHMLANSSDMGWCCTKAMLTIGVIIILYIIKRRPSIANHERCLWIKIAYIIFTLVFYGIFCGQNVAYDSRRIYYKLKNKIRGQPDMGAIQMGGGNIPPAIDMNGNGKKKNGNGKKKTATSAGAIRKATVPTKGATLKKLTTP